MDQGALISKINTYLYEASAALLAWLDDILPRVADSWWQDCVLPSLSYTQREIAVEKCFSKLSDFDLAALLRIANKSWYDMRTVAYLPTQERECVREMITVRNNWAHCSAELPGKDTILHDLKTIQTFIKQVNGSEKVCFDIDDLISLVESPDSIKQLSKLEDKPSIEAAEAADETVDTGVIAENTLVYLVASPEKRGIVRSLSALGGTTKYEVFVDGALHTFYSGQIAPVEAAAEYEWIDADAFRSRLTAYQINNPSASNLYSLNSARIDFVPYQFRPALKLIHADEPRILIADSVGVGKTIEAGLIIKELEARSELERVLIICPRPLVAEKKWEQEMKRFDEDFIPLDGATFRRAISDADRDGEWPIRYNKAIIPYSILDGRAYNGEIKKRGATIGLSELDPAPRFDLVIVDEAHHIRNGSMSKDKAYAYKSVKFFCDHADAVVMLTATPLQTSDNDLFTLLNVLRPDVVIDKKTFAMMARPNEYISQCVRIIRGAQDDWMQKAARTLLALKKTQWGDDVISENPIYDDILLRLESNEISREERVKLISDVESLHSFGAMLNRTRRRDIQDFCVRRSHTIEAELTPTQRELHDELLSFERQALSLMHDVRSVPFMMTTIKRQAASCVFGLAPHIRDIIGRRFSQMNDDPELEPDDFDVDEAPTAALSQLAKRVLELADNLPTSDPKLEKTLEIIRQKQALPNNKIMLFSTFRHTLGYLRRRLSEQGLRVEQVDGSVSDERRYEYKERFALPKDEADAIDILLFTEIGSEGLDYQFCDMMINYDLPWNPMRIEQRIGRIDRRGQESEAVNIYNVITSDTVDADIYYRCLMRIGVFERSIGECEEILGGIAAQIGQIAVDTRLTEAERREKLEQMADNEIRKIQELNRLEEEEKGLFGFDLSEFVTSQEIRNAENPWLTQQNLKRLIERYLKARVGESSHFIGEGSVITLRLSAAARATLLEDARELPGGRSMLKRSWESYLKGKVPTQEVTFDSEGAERNRKSFFITAHHPLAKQAARYFGESKPFCIHLEYYSSAIPAGTYPFCVYAWRYLGQNAYFKLVTVCGNETLALELPDILQSASSASARNTGRPAEWSALESEHVSMWMEAKDKHIIDVNTTARYKLESLANSHRNREIMLEQQISDALDESIRRMRIGELEAARENYVRKVAAIKTDAARADIHTALLAKGAISIRKG